MAKLIFIRERKEPLNEMFEPADNLERAILLYLIKEIERNYWNNNQKELKDSPFENTGARLTIFCEDVKMEAKAYDWEKEEHGYFKFWFYGKLAYEYRWYKHCMRCLEVNRHDTGQDEFLDLAIESMEFYWVKSEEE